jgi:hypothetical protein
MHLGSGKILKSKESTQVIVVAASASTSSERGRVCGEGARRWWGKERKKDGDIVTELGSIYPLHGNDIISLHCPIREKLPLHFQKISQAPPDVAWA